VDEQLIINKSSNIHTWIIVQTFSSWYRKSYTIKNFSFFQVAVPSLICTVDEQLIINKSSNIHTWIIVQYSISNLTTIKQQTYNPCH
jgi:uncharacterized membrane protein YesL